MTKPIIVFTSGFFDPVHAGHIELFELAKKLGDKLIVAVNNDSQTMQKKGFVFMPAEEKAKIIAENDADIPSNQHRPKTSLASPSPIQAPYDASQNKANGKAMRGPDKKSKTDGIWG